MPPKSTGKSAASRAKPRRVPERTRDRDASGHGFGSAASNIARLLGTLAMLPFRTRGSTEWFVTAALIIAMVGGWLVLKPTLLDRVAASHAEIVKVELEVPVSPEGHHLIPNDITQWMMSLVHERVTNDSFATEDLEAARRTLLSTGWLRPDLTIQRHPEGRVAVSGSWRRPAAVVHDGADRYLVAQDSSPLFLPVGFALDRSLYSIRNPSNPPPRRETQRGERWHIEIAYGEAWPGPDVQAAIDLLGLIDQSPVRTQVMGVDLAEFPQDGHLVLVTDSGSRIVWGSPANPDGTVPPGEQPIATRLERMEAFLATHRRIDAGHSNLLIYTPTVLTAPAGPRTARP